MLPIEEYAETTPTRQLNQVVNQNKFSGNKDIRLTMVQMSHYASAHKSTINIYMYLAVVYDIVFRVLIMKFVCVCVCVPPISITIHIICAPILIYNNYNYSHQFL